MYKLPEARSSLHDSWSGCELRGFVPNANQQLVIDVVRSALDAGLYYTRDVRDHCARAIGLNAVDDKANFQNMPVEGGVFGMECYYARKYLDARKVHAAEDEVSARLRPHVGQRLGTVMFNDFKRCTGAVITKVAGEKLELQCKRGTSLLTFEVSVLSVKHGIDRAAEKKLRKDDFDGFVLGAHTPALVDGSDCDGHPSLF